MPSDLKFGNMKNHALAAQIRAKENQKMMVRSGSLQGLQLAKIDPQVIEFEKKRQLQLHGSSSKQNPIQLQTREQQNLSL